MCSLDAIGVDTTGEVLVVTDARRREVYWARYRDGVRVDGPAVASPADVPVDADAVAGSPDHAALFELPRLAPTYPTASGLVRAVDWDRRSGAVDPAVSAASRCQATAGAVVTVEYGELTVGDADRCAELEAQLFPGDDPWPAVAFLRELESKHNHYVAARVDGTLVGYAGISRLGRKPPYEYEVHTIGVDTRVSGSRYRPRPARPSARHRGR